LYIDFLKPKCAKVADGVTKAITEKHRSPPVIFGLDDGVRFAYIASRSRKFDPFHALTDFWIVTRAKK